MSINVDKVHNVPQFFYNYWLFMMFVHRREQFNFPDWRWHQVIYIYISSELRGQNNISHMGDISYIPEGAGGQEDIYSYCTEGLEGLRTT